MSRCTSVGHAVRFYLFSAIFCFQTNSLFYYPLGLSGQSLGNAVPFATAPVFRLSDTMHVFPVQLSPPATMARSTTCRADSLSFPAAAPTVLHGLVQGSPLSSADAHQDAQAWAMTSNDSWTAISANNGWGADGWGPNHVDVGAANPHTWGTAGWGTDDVDDPWSSGGASNRMQTQLLFVAELHQILNEFACLTHLRYRYVWYSHMRSQGVTEITRAQEQIKRYNDKIRVTHARYTALTHHLRLLRHPRVSNRRIETQVDKAGTFYVGANAKVHSSCADTFSDVNAGPVQVVIGWDSALVYAEKLAKERLTAGSSKAALDSMDVDC
ncbi:hypothetical protein C8R43DRAFT_1125777 [Mycena crocata]|nr:hypothetical protein C8R43DRAFT_1125777 [Mycena crocata]